MANRPDLSDSIDQLMKNQETIGQVYAMKYGHYKGQQLTGLLKQHISQAIDIVKGLIAKQDVKDLIDMWYANANLIGNLMASDGFDQMRTMMIQHLNLTTKEAIDIVNNTNSVNDFVNVENEALGMANYMARVMCR